MADVSTRLMGCIAAVLPALDPEEIPRASARSVKAWDSLATATLVSLVEEEFGIEVPAEDLARFVSFQEVLGYLQGRLQRSEGGLIENRGPF